MLEVVSRLEEFENGVIKVAGGLLAAAGTSANVIIVKLFYPEISVGDHLRTTV